MDRHMKGGGPRMKRRSVLEPLGGDEGSSGVGSSCKMLAYDCSLRPLSSVRQPA